MKKLIIFIVICFVIVCVLLACSFRPGTVGATKLYEAYELGNKAIPIFIDIGGDADKFDEVKLLETDNYGRRLYLYWCRSTYSFLLICQKCEKVDDYDFKLYWYDECWAGKPSPESFESFSVEEIESLKELNDWGKPFNEHRLNSSQVYRFNCNRSKEECDTFWNYQNLLDADRETVSNAVNVYYDEELLIGPLIYRNDLIYAIAYAQTEYSGIYKYPEKAYFICFDPSTASIVRETEYKGELYECRDDFIIFYE